MSKLCVFCPTCKVCLDLPDKLPAALKLDPIIIGQCETCSNHFAVTVVSNKLVFFPVQIVDIPTELEVSLFDGEL